MTRRVQIGLRLTEDEVQSLTSAAEAAGMNREAYLRQLLFHGPPVTSEVMARLFDATTEVNRLRVAVNDLIRKLPDQSTDLEDTVVRPMRSIENQLLRLWDIVAGKGS